MYSSTSMGEVSISPETLILDMPAAARRADGIATMERTAVIIDDSRFLSKQIVSFFEGQLGFCVVGVGGDGNEAVELCRKYKPDLITLDITMPNKDGRQAIREILRENPDANILMISAVKGAAMLECITMGAKGYIEKPLRFSNADFVTDFRETIEEIFKD